MQFSLNNLYEFLDTTRTSDEIIASLTMLGIEVEKVTKRNDLNGFKIVKIISAQPHPNADKLRVCKVDDGNDIIDIVCGAKNAVAGLITVFAPIGITIPANGLKIKESVIRGEKSCGMLCSYSELNVAVEAEGIISLGSDAVIGTSFKEYVGLDDIFIDVSITPNRGDLFSVYGIARDLAAADLGVLKQPVIPIIEESFRSNIEIKNLTSKNVKNFFCCEIRNIKNQISPVWLQNKLKALGIKSISAVVDVTNFMAMYYGQPMHAYDKNKISNELVLKFADRKQKFHALDEKEYELTDQDLVICDDNQNLALLGIMGGENSKTTLDTNHIMLEAACFDRVKIALTGQKYNIISEARTRFERGVDPKFTENALLIAARLIQEICGGEISDVKNIESKFKDNFTNENSISFNTDYINKLLSTQFSDAFVHDAFSKSGIKIEAAENSEYRAITPSYRYDLGNAQNLAGELLRLVGFDAIPDKEIILNIEPVKLPENYNQMIKIRHLLSSIGFDEMITWSFVNADKIKDFKDENKEIITLENPISQEHKFMRTNLAAGLIEAYSNNFKRGIENIRLFEIGKIYDKNFENFERNVLGLLRAGEDIDRNTHVKPKIVDFFVIKSDIENILNLYNVKFSEIEMTRETPDYYHPGRSATVKYKSGVIAYFGMLHPKITKKYDISKHTALGEIFLDNLSIQSKNLVKKNYVNFPIVKRDMAFFVSSEMPARKLLDEINSLNIKIIKKVNIFDCYQKQGEDRKSLAFTLFMQSDTHTLSEQEINDTFYGVIRHIENLGGILRDNVK